MAKAPKPKDISTLTHDAARRINVPTAEMASLSEQNEELLGMKWKPLRVPRDRPLAAGEVRERDADRDPQIIWNGAKITLTPAQVRQLSETGTVEIGDAQLVWRGKDTQDWSDLVVNAPPLYIQEKVHPKAIIDDLKRRSDASRKKSADEVDLFADFNGLSDPEARAEFYRHSMHWQNRFILGDSLQVMASLAQREGLKGKVQAIYFDPPYGIKFNSNWQVSTLSRDVKDGKAQDMSREPEQIKAFRDTWKDGIHSYLTYLRDRLTVARELLTESGSIFVQIGDENVHRVRALMDEVFGAENFVSEVDFKTTTGRGGRLLDANFDTLIWYAKNAEKVKYRQLFIERDERRYDYVADPAGQAHMFGGLRKDAQSSWRPYNLDNFTSQGETPESSKPITLMGQSIACPKGRHWRIVSGRDRLVKAGRLEVYGKQIRCRVFAADQGVTAIDNVWDDVLIGSFSAQKVYVVQTSQSAIERCLLMATDPGDLVLDPTCGSGTTATVAEQWGRRWITIDTSRVALALARTRLMSARYPYYLLKDSPEGRAKEGELTGRIPADGPTGNDVRRGFVYERAPHITLKSIANNAEIDIIWERWQQTLEPLRATINSAINANWQEWEVPRVPEIRWPDNMAAELRKARDTKFPMNARVAALAVINKAFGRNYTLDNLPEHPADTFAEHWPMAVEPHAKWWEARIARQQEIDASIARAADVELLYDRPYEDKNKVRVAGPFTVESLSPHRVMTARDDSLGAAIAAAEGTLQRDPANVPEADFGAMVLDNLRTAGVHQRDKADAIRFNSLEPWPGKWIAAEGRYTDGDDRERRAAILIGPEFGTLTHSQITAAAREASMARFDTLIACAFNFDAMAGELDKLGPLPIVKARMNPDLHMAEDLKNTGKGNLFVVFGEPDIKLIDAPNGELQVQVLGVDVFDPSTGDIRSDGKDGIAAWFIDTDYNEESFFVRHAYFLGSAASGDGPYKSLKTALKAEIDEDAWATLYSDISRPFPRPSSSRIAVKVINHFGDEVLKVFGV